MIPKIIHYCWFGKNKKSILVEKCINSWKMCCPDYKIIEWNEDNFDIQSNAYAKEAYDKKKWAFVSDYARLKILSEQGGFYLDTDVELIKPLDSFCDCNAVVGYESSTTLSTAFIGAEKNNEWITYLLSYYENRHFVLSDGSLDLTTNVTSITEMTKSKYVMQFDDKKYSIPGIVTFYPKEYFAPKNPGEKHYKITDNTVAIHHFETSWIPGNREIVRLRIRYSRQLKKVKKFIIAIIGKENFEKLKNH